MSSSDLESQQTSSRGLSSISRRGKIILSLALLLGAVAAVGVCAAAVGLGVASSNSGGSEQPTNEETRSLSGTGEVSDRKVICALV